MALGGAPDWDRFANWPRGLALATLATILALLAWAVASASAPTASALPPANAEAQAPQPASTLQLYQRIAARVAAGDGYYAAAIEEQRAAGFAVRPGLAVRLPTMAYLNALMGEEALAALLLLGALTAATWYLRLGDEPGGQERQIIGTALVVAGMAAGLNPAYPVLHEVWAGLFVALALGVHRPGRWHWTWLAAAAALAIREHALPVVVLFGAMAAWRRDWKETAAWAALAGLFLVGLWLHLAEVHRLVVPADRPADNWLALRGMWGLVGNVVQTSPLRFLPLWIAAPVALLPLVGWAGWKSPLGAQATLLCAGYGLVFVLAGRAGDFHWGLMIVPVWFVGLALLPMALRSLWRAAFSR